MKVMHIITKSEIGGAQTWVRDQIFLFEKDYKHVLVTNKDGWLTQEVFELATVHTVKGIESFFSLFSFIKIFKIIFTESPDLIISSSANAGVIARVCSLFFKNTRVIYVSHGWSCIYNKSKFSKFFIFVERILSYLTNIIICVSDKDYLDAQKIIGIKKEKLLVIRNAIFPRVLSDHEHSNPLRALFVGRLNYPKRPDLLLDSIVDNKNVILDIVGDGALNLEKYKSQSNVRFLGAISNFDKYHEYDIFVLISDSEGLPMSALEAASSGLPLILSDVGGCPELISGNGLLVSNNVTSIKSAIDDISNNYSLFKRNAMSNVESTNIYNVKHKYKLVYNK
jgi:glycosyltransferase involved in cell wall biosynthesis